MDKFPIEIEKVKVLSLKINYANKHFDDLETEKVVIKSCVSEINQYLHHMLETRDSILTVLVHQHLSEKLKLVFAMLNHIEGVFEGDVLPKQAGEKVK